MTVEDCVRAIGNHFALAVIGAQRARALAQGVRPLVICDNNHSVTALREIAAGKVSINESVTSVLEEHSRAVKALDGIRRPRRSGVARPTGG